MCVKNYMPFNLVYRPEVMSLTLKKDEANGLHGLEEYIYRCFVEELYQMVEADEVTGLDPKAINHQFLAECIKELRKFLIEGIDFTLYQAITLHVEGILAKVMRSNIRPKASQIPQKFHFELLVKFCLTWIDCLIRKR